MAQTQARRETAPIRILAQPLYSLLLPIPVLCFVGTLLVDLAYRRSGGNLMWLNFSSWLLLTGLLFGVIAALLLLVEVVRAPRLRSGAGWAHMGLFYAALIVEFVNIFVHSRDGWTAVVPTGFTLSLIGTALILLAAWLWPVAVREAVR